MNIMVVKIGEYFDVNFFVIVVYDGFFISY